MCRGRIKADLMQWDSPAKGQPVPRAEEQSLVLHFMQDGISENCSSCEMPHEESSSRRLSWDASVPSCFRIALGFGGDIHRGLCGEQQGLLAFRWLLTLHLPHLRAQAVFLAWKPLTAPFWTMMMEEAPALCHLPMRSRSSASHLQEMKHGGQHGKEEKVRMHCIKS